MNVVRMWYLTRFVAVIHGFLSLLLRMCRVGYYDRSLLSSSILLGPAHGAWRMEHEGRSVAHDRRKAYSQKFKGNTEMKGVY